ncbi:GNAT family N-acetyltransferase [Methanospirillum sp.]|uniref:GNAT family N-acetyltransferase n=1 Tax=Methanospirillum sp. TaxID=45200 RepID=UPI002D1FA1EC|nr:GNAT family N-acetyltransferase [Methanospirillum sp.]
MVNPRDHIKTLIAGGMSLEEIANLIINNNRTIGKTKESQKELMSRLERVKREEVGEIPDIPKKYRDYIEMNANTMHTDNLLAPVEEGLRVALKPLIYATRARTVSKITPDILRSIGIFPNEINTLSVNHPRVKRASRELTKRGIEIAPSAFFGELRRHQSFNRLEMEKIRNGGSIANKIRRARSGLKPKYYKTGEPFRVGGNPLSNKPYNAIFKNNLKFARLEDQMKDMQIVKSGVSQLPKSVNLSVIPPVDEAFLKRIDQFILEDKIKNRGVKKANTGLNALKNLRLTRIPSELEMPHFDREKIVGDFIDQSFLHLADHSGYAGTGMMGEALDEMYFSGLSGSIFDFNGIPVGAESSGIKGKFYEMTRLGVSDHPKFNFQGQGLGKQLFNMALEKAQALQMPMIWTSAANPHTLEFYKRQPGAQRRGKSLYEFIIPYKKALGGLIKTYPKKKTITLTLPSFLEKPYSMLSSVAYRVAPRYIKEAMTGYRVTEGMDIEKKRKILQIFNETIIKEQNDKFYELYRDKKNHSLLLDYSKPHIRGIEPNTELYKNVQNVFARIPKSWRRTLASQMGNYDFALEIHKMKKTDPYYNFSAGYYNSASNEIHLKDDSTQDTILHELIHSLYKNASPNAKQIAIERLRKELKIYAVGDDSYNVYSKMTLSNFIPFIRNYYGNLNELFAYSIEDIKNLHIRRFGGSSIPKFANGSWINPVLQRNAQQSVLKLRQLQSVAKIQQLRKQVTAKNEHHQALQQRMLESVNKIMQMRRHVQTRVRPPNYDNLMNPSINLAYKNAAGNDNRNYRAVIRHIRRPLFENPDYAKEVMQFMFGSESGMNTVVSNATTQFQGALQQVQSWIPKSNDNTLIKNMLEQFTIGDPDERGFRLVHFKPGDMVDPNLIKHIYDLSKPVMDAEMPNLNWMQRTGSNYALDNLDTIINNLKIYNGKLNKMGLVAALDSKSNELLSSLLYSNFTPISTYVNFFGTRGSVRGKGIGSQVFVEAMKHAYESGVTKFSLTPLKYPETLRFYRRHGMDRNHEFDLARHVPRLLREQSIMLGGISVDEQLRGIHGNSKTPNAIIRNINETVLDRLKQRYGKRASGGAGGIDALVSNGEYTVSSAFLRKIGGGNAQTGAGILDMMRSDSRYDKRITPDEPSFGYLDMFSSGGSGISKIVGPGDVDDDRIYAKLRVTGGNNDQAYIIPGFLRDALSSAGRPISHSGIFTGKSFATGGSLIGSDLPSFMYGGLLSSDANQSGIIVSLTSGFNGISVLVKTLLRTNTILNKLNTILYNTTRGYGIGGLGDTALQSKEAPTEFTLTGKPVRKYEHLGPEKEGMYRGHVVRQYLSGYRSINVGFPDMRNWNPTDYFAPPEEAEMSMLGKARKDMIIWLKNKQNMWKEMGERFWNVGAGKEYITSATFETIIGGQFEDIPREDYAEILKTGKLKNGQPINSQLLRYIKNLDVIENLEDQLKDFAETIFGHKGARGWVGVDISKRMEDVKVYKGETGQGEPIIDIEPREVARITAEIKRTDTELKEMGMTSDQVKMQFEQFIRHALKDTKSTIPVFQNFERRIEGIRREFTTLWKTGNMFKDISWRFASLSMSAMGVYFSIQGVVMTLRQGFSSLLTPLSDIENLFKSIGMSNTFAEETIKANKVMKDLGVNTNTLLKSWKDITGLQASWSVGLASFGARIFNPETIDAISTSFTNVFESINESGNIEKMQEFFKALPEALPPILTGLNTFVDIIKFISTNDMFGKGWILQMSSMALVVSLFLQPITAFGASLMTISGAIIKTIAYLKGLSDAFALGTITATGFANVLKGIAVFAVNGILVWEAFAFAINTVAEALNQDFRLPSLLSSFTGVTNVQDVGKLLGFKKGDVFENGIVQGEREGIDSVPAITPQGPALIAPGEAILPADLVDLYGEQNVEKFIKSKNINDLTGNRKAEGDVYSNGTIYSPDSAILTFRQISSDNRKYMGDISKYTRETSDYVNASFDAGAFHVIVDNETWNGGAGANPLSGNNRVSLTRPKSVVEEMIPYLGSGMKSVSPLDLVFKGLKIPEFKIPESAIKIIPDALFRFFTDIIGKMKNILDTEKIKGIIDSIIKNITDFLSKTKEKVPTSILDEAIDRATKRYGPDTGKTKGTIEDTGKYSWIDTSEGYSYANDVLETYEKFVPDTGKSTDSFFSRLFKGLKGISKPGLLKDLWGGGEYNIKEGMKPTDPFTIMGGTRVAAEYGLDSPEFQAFMLNSIIAGGAWLGGSRLLTHHISPYLINKGIGIAGAEGAGVLSKVGGLGLIKAGGGTGMIGNVMGKGLSQAAKYLAPAASVTEIANAGSLMKEGKTPEEIRESQKIQDLMTFGLFRYITSVGYEKNLEEGKQDIEQSKTLDKVINESLNSQNPLLSPITETMKGIYNKPIETLFLRNPMLPTSVNPEAFKGVGKEILNLTDYIPGTNGNIKKFVSDAYNDVFGASTTDIFLGGKYFAKGIAPTAEQIGTAVTTFDPNMFLDSTRQVLGGFLESVGLKSNETKEEKAEAKLSTEDLRSMLDLYTVLNQNTGTSSDTENLVNVFNSMIPEKGYNTVMDEYNISKQIQNINNTQNPNQITVQVGDVIVQVDSQGKSLDDIMRDPKLVDEISYAVARQLGSYRYV